MIQVVIYKERCYLKGFKVVGHANYTKNNEDDIVCAAVSILVHTALNSFNRVAEIPVKDIEFSVEEKEGILEIHLKSINEKSEVIFNSFIIGIKLLLEDYGEYIALKYEEV